MFVDSHCHLDKLDLDKLDLDNSESRSTGLAAVFERAAERDISHMLCIGIDMGNIQAVLELAEAQSNVFATVGVHPLYQENRTPSVDELVHLSKHPKVVGIGETGLDYFYCKGDLSWQRERFITHIQAAVKCDMPLIVHTRGAKEDTLDLMRQYGGGELKGVLHCFTEDLDMALQAVDMGFYISISGIVTFNNASELREVVSNLPLDKLLIETDSPWLTPAPHRGSPNEPKHVLEVAKKIAEIKQIPVETVGEVTTANFFSLFSKAE
ncbi:hydrolase TatD [Gammaproteobacteria bacterium 45_16_T64]|nr:hydrolase TatD [Gammaproteobacteria bacterium 45_16_T64]